MVIARLESTSGKERGLGRHGESRRGMGCFGEIS